MYPNRLWRPLCELVTELRVRIRLVGSLSVYSRSAASDKVETSLTRRHGYAPCKGVGVALDRHKRQEMWVHGTAPHVILTTYVAYLRLGTSHATREQNRTATSPQQSQSASHPPLLSFMSDVEIQDVARLAQQNVPVAFQAISKFVAGFRFDENDCYIDKPPEGEKTFLVELGKFPGIISGKSYKDGLPRRHVFTVTAHLEPTTFNVFGGPPPLGQGQLYDRVLFHEPCCWLVPTRYSASGFGQLEAYIRYCIEVHVGEGLYRKLPRSMYEVFTNACGSIASRVNASLT